jgi:hypothetical protein
MRLLGATVSRILGFHQVAGEAPDLAALHLENVTKYKGQGSTILTSGQDRALRDDNVAFLNKPPYLDDCGPRNPDRQCDR